MKISSRSIGASLRKFYKEKFFTSTASRTQQNQSLLSVYLNHPNKMNSAPRLLFRSLRTNPFKTSDIFFSSIKPNIKAQSRLISTSPSKPASRNSINHSSILAISLVTLGLSCYSIKKSSPLLNDVAVEQRLTPVQQYERSSKVDPLSSLSPEVLSQVRSHLDEIKTIDLIKCWIVYASSS